MTEHVQYIDKTRAYYRRAGYTQDYGWANNDGCALTPLPKPLKDCRVGLVSTASLVRISDQGEALDASRIMGTSRLEVFELDSDWPSDRLRSTSEDHDRFQTDMTDVGAYFPKDALKALADQGHIAGFAQTCWRILPNYSKRKVSHVDAPEVLRLARAAGVDAMLITPV